MYNNPFVCEHNPEWTVILMYDNISLDGTIIHMYVNIILDGTIIPRLQGLNDTKIH